MIHRNGNDRHRSGYNVPSKSHEAERRGSVDLVDEDDVEIRAGEDGDQTISEEDRADNRGPDANMRLNKTLADCATQ